MSAVGTIANIKSIEIEAVVFRNDGTIEDLGVVSQWHKDPRINRLRERAIKIREALRKSNERTK